MIYYSTIVGNDDCGSVPSYKLYFANENDLIDHLQKVLIAHLMTWNFPTLGKMDVYLKFIKDQSISNFVIITIGIELIMIVIMNSTQAT